MKKVVYFLCTGNSCRSQMAEGWARSLGGDRIEVHSAGIEMHGLNRRAVEAMREVGIDISHHVSKLIDPAILNRTDYVVTLCGEAEETCPWTPPSITRLYWPFPDPAKKTGTEADVQLAFRAVRDGIREKVEEFIEQVIGRDE